MTTKRPKKITLRQFVTQESIRLVKFHSDYRDRLAFDPDFYDTEKEEQDWSETLNGWPD